MIELYAFIAGSPWVSFFLAWLMAWSFRIFCIYFINRPLRTMKVMKHGWPPSHLDADGDINPNHKEEDVKF